MIDHMGAKTAITPDELIHMPRPENGKHYELSERELIVVGNAGMLHELIKRAFLKFMFAYEEKHPEEGAVFAETQFTMINGGARIPDIAFIKAGKMASLPRPDVAAPCAPDLAIEVISESETASYSEKKATEYLDSDVSELWRFYPALRKVRVRTAAGIRDLTGDDVLQSPLLPGFRIAVSKIFEV